MLMGFVQSGPYFALEVLPIIDEAMRLKHSNQTTKDRNDLYDIQAKLYMQYSAHVYVAEYTRPVCFEKTVTVEQLSGHTHRLSQ